MDWKGILADLRAHLPPGGGEGRLRGSLRWLEAEMRARGANPAALRNIVYKDLGTPADKAALRGILEDLAREVGRPLPDAAPPPGAALPEDLELLGRSKKRAYKQFLAGVRAGRAPRLIVTGRAGAGKTVLLDHLERALLAQGHAVARLSLGGDAARQLALPAALDSSFAAQAQAQADAARAALTPGRVVLARVTEDLHFGGGPPRGLDGAPLSAGRWALGALLERAPPGTPVLLALEGTPGDPVAHEVIELHPPTLAEARTYLMTRLNLTRSEAERLARETGRHLDRLTLLVQARGGPGAGADLLADPDTRALTAATAALNLACPAPEVGWPEEALALALDGPLAARPAHARALLTRTPQGTWQATAALEAAWPRLPAAEARPALERLGTAGPELGAVRVGALVALGEHDALSRHLAAQPDDARHLPAHWPALRHAARGEAREALARAVVAHHAGRGEYGAPPLRDALFTLLESPRPAVRAWAWVKLAESSLEAGHMDRARGQLEHPDVRMAAQGRDPWSQAAQADALLVEAALSRWAGDLEAATRAAEDPRTAGGGPRALLWRGLIAKDAGRWADALRALQAVPRTSPLLSARARYQEGDLRLRLGQPAAALGALEEAAARLEAAGAAPEERARVLARTATAQRRLGHPARGLETLHAALALLPPDDRRHADGVPRARLLSEGVPLLLALGRPDDAVAQALEALACLDRAGSRAAEAAYRSRRTRYRLALAYLSRGLGAAYLQPLLGARHDHPDLRHARAALDDLIAHSPAGSDREGILVFDMHLSRALADPEPRAALAAAERALDLAQHAYEEAQARALRAETLLRAGRPGAALPDLNRAHALLRRVSAGLAGDHAPDPGLRAQLLALEARATVAEGAPALRWLRQELEAPDLAPFRRGVWRAVGEALETGHPDPATVLQELYPEWRRPPVRLADLLWLAEQPSAEAGAPQVWPSAPRTVAPSTVAPRTVDPGAAGML